MIKKLLKIITGGAEKQLQPQSNQGGGGGGASIFSGGGGYNRTAGYDKIAKEGYQDNPIGYKCVSEVANSAAQIPFRVMVGDEEVAEDHPLVRLLERPQSSAGGGRVLSEPIFLPHNGRQFVRRAEHSQRPTARTAAFEARQSGDQDQ